MSEKKKVLLLTSVASMIDQFNMQNIEVLQNMGIEPYVAANFIKGNTCTERELIALKQRLSDLHVPFYQIDFDRNAFNLVSDFRAYKQIKKICEDNNFAFIHCQSPIGGVIGRLVGKKNGIKTIYTAHGFHFFKGAGIKNWIFFYPIEKWLSNYTDVLIVMNMEDEQSAKVHRFGAKKTVMFEPVGVDLQHYGASNENRRAELRRKFGFKKDDYIMIFTGEFNKRKNQEFLIKSMQILKKRIPSSKLILFGKGPGMKKAQVLAEKLGVKDSVLFKGFCPFEELIEHYQLSNLFVSASKQEGLPKNLKEAMACGLPAVVSKIRGNVDLIVHNSGGLIYEKGDMNEFIENVCLIASDSTLSTQYGEYNLKRIEDFSEESARKRIREIYESVIL